MDPPDEASRDRLAGESRMEAAPKRCDDPGYLESALRLCVSRPKHRAAPCGSQGRRAAVFVKHSYPTLVVGTSAGGSFWPIA
jgi:hypothetical protein